MNLASISIEILLVAAALFALFVFWSEPLWFLPALERLTPNIVYRARTSLPLVALSCVLGCAYPHDPVHPPVWYIRWLIEKNLVAGAIVILHDGISDPSRSLQALPHILDAAHRKGLRLASISELIRNA